MSRGPGYKLKTPCEKRKDAFKAMDLFGQYVTLTHEGEFTFNSMVGSAATVLFILITFSYGLSALVPVLSQEINTIK
jgi:hypothetical protein